LVEGVVELLGVLVFGVDCEFGVVAVPFGLVVAPLEVEPGVIVPLLLVPVVSVELPVFEDCGTADPLDPEAGTQFALAVLEVPGVELVLVEVVDVLLGDVLLLELGIELVELLGEVLLLELGEVELLEVLGVEVVVLVVPVAFALVRGTMPAGQLLVEEALGVVEPVLLVEEPVCEEDGIVELLPVELPVCDEVEGVVELLPVVLCDPLEEVEGELVVVVVFVVEEVCAAAHVAHAVRTRIIVNFFMFSVLVVSSGYILRCPFLRAGAPVRIRKKASIRRPFWLIFDVSYLRILRRNQAPSPIEPPPRSVSRGSGEAVCGIPFADDPAF
jgi:hypothetical protein